MTVTALQSRRPTTQFDFPAWVADLDQARFRVIRAFIKGAAHLSPADLERQTTAAYSDIAKQIDAAPRRFPVRFWNHIPAIHHPSGPGIDRYMVFNAGRFVACSRWLADAHGFERHLPAASAVGHDGDDLFINALAASAPGVAIENPLQVPAYRYSTRYGPRPPCFSRATLLGDLLMVGGTASIVGEDSSGQGNLESQIDQTLTNLASLIRKALGDMDEPLRRFKDLRVYYVREKDVPAIKRAIKCSFDGLKRLEMVPADLCRRELLVEIEGIAR